MFIIDLTGNNIRYKEKMNKWLSKEQYDGRVTQLIVTEEQKEKSRMMGNQ